MFKFINLYLVNLQLVRGQFFQKDKKTITNKTRELTVWSNSHIYDIDMMKKLGLSNCHDYRASLQSNGENIIKNTLNDFDKNYKCVNTQSNIFYIDSSKYNQYYDTK